MSEYQQDASGSGATPNRGSTDAELCDLDGMIEKLGAFNSGVETWTIPTGPTPGSGRRVHQHGSGPMLNALAKPLKEHLWAAREKLFEKYAVAVGSGSASSTGQFEAIIPGWGGMNFPLITVIEDLRDILFVPTARARNERDASPQGIPKDAGFRLNDIIPGETLDRLRSAAMVLGQVRDGIAASDPFAVLFPGQTGPHVAAAQVAWGPPPEASPHLAGTTSNDTGAAQNTSEHEAPRSQDSKGRLHIWPSVRELTLVLETRAGRNLPELVLRLSQGPGATPLEHRITGRTAPYLAKIVIENPDKNQTWREVWESGNARSYWESATPTSLERLGRKIRKELPSWLRHCWEQNGSLVSWTTGQ